MNYIKKLTRDFYNHKVGSFIHHPRISIPVKGTPA